MKQRSSSDLTHLSGFCHWQRLTPPDDGNDLSLAQGQLFFGRKFLLHSNKYTLHPEYIFKQLIFIGIFQRCSNRTVQDYNFPVTIPAKGHRPAAISKKSTINDENVFFDDIVGEINYSDISKYKHYLH